MPGRERPRPEAERAHLSGHRQAEQFGKLDQLVAGSAPGGLVADAHQRVVCFEQHARGFFDIVLVRTDAHGHVELGLLPDGRGCLLAQRIGGKRNEHRAARRGGGELHAAADGVRDRARGLRRPVPFGDGLRHDLAVVRLLKKVSAKRALLHRGDRHHNGDLILPAVDHLRHGIGQPDIRHDDDAGLAGNARIAVRHGNHRAFVNALDQLDAGLVDERIENRIIAGRRVEEDMPHTGGLELLHEKRAAGSLHRPHGGRRRRCRGLAEGRERLRHRPGGETAHAERAQPGHQPAAGNSVVEILLDQILHGILLARFPVALNVVAISPHSSSGRRGNAAALR